jgi:hypothetical protein
MYSLTPKADIDVRLGSVAKCQKQTFAVGKDRRAAVFQKMQSGATKSGQPGHSDRPVHRLHRRARGDLQHFIGNAVAPARLRICSSQGVRRSVPSCAAQAQYPNREPSAAYFACTCRGWAWGRNHSIGCTNSTLYIARCTHNARAKAASRAAICRVGQAARPSTLCSRLLRVACGTYA